MTTVAVARTLDLQGLACPIPVIRTAKAMKELAQNELLEVLATDPGSRSDMIAWCAATKNEIVEQDAHDGVFRYVLRKR